MGGKRLGWIGTLVALASMVTIAGAGAPDAPSAAARVEFHIASQSVGQALTALGEQTGFTIVVESALARDMIAPALDGRYTVDEALRKILAPLGLRAEYLDKHTIAVFSSRVPATTPTRRAHGED